MTRVLSRTGTLVRDLVHLRPAPPGGHRVALRAGLSVAVPLLTVVLVGHAEWSIYAAFGAFTSLYGRNHVHLSRAVMQLTAAITLVGSVVLGAVAAAAGAGPWAAIVIGTGVAGVGATASTVFDWHPPGPLFMIFAFGTVSAAPAQAHDVPIAAAVSSASALVAIVIGNVGAIARRTPRPPVAQLRPLTSARPLRPMVAVAVAGSLSTAAGIGHPWWAMVAAVAPLTAPNRTHQLLRAGHRITGTTLGLVPAAGLLLLDLPPVPLVLVVVVLQVVTELLVARNYALALLCITPMALLMGTLGSAQAVGDLLLDRGVETAIGGLVAVVLLVIEHQRAQVW